MRFPPAGLAAECLDQSEQLNSVFCIGQRVRISGTIGAPFQRDIGGAEAIRSLGSLGNISRFVFYEDSFLLRRKQGFDKRGGRAEVSPPDRHLKPTAVA